MKATQKQVNYALHLMDELGYGTKWMAAEHKALGATMRERSGRVDEWLADKTKFEISKLIDDLKERLEDKRAKEEQAD